MDKKHCSGCRNNFYNGNNNLGVKECWQLKSARLKKRYAIGYNVPTYQENFYQVRKPSCYHSQGTVYVDSIKVYPRKK